MAWPWVFQRATTIFLLSSGGIFWLFWPIRYVQWILTLALFVVAFVTALGWLETPIKHSSSPLGTFGFFTRTWWHLVLSYSRFSSLFFPASSPRLSLSLSPSLLPRSPSANFASIKRTLYYSIDTNAHHFDSQDNVSTWITESWPTGTKYRCGLVVRAIRIRCGRFELVYFGFLGQLLGGRVRMSGQRWGPHLCKIGGQGTRRAAIN